MSYCKYCQNILKIVKNKEYDELTVQELMKDDLVNLLTKKSNAKQGQYINDDVPYRINFAIEELDNIDINMKQFKGENIDDVRNELKSIYEEIIKGNSNANMFNFLCTNCSMTYYLQPGTVIDTVNFRETNYVQDETPDIRFDDPTLFRTKDFICVNNKCVTNTDKSAKIQEEKEAVFYKLQTHNIKYICKHCKTQWGT
jgi:hypothetical protein